MFLAPPADGLVTHLQTTTDFAVIQALCKQFHSLEPTLLQSHEVAPNASRIAHAGLDTAKLNFVPLYYARFSRPTLPTHGYSGPLFRDLSSPGTEGFSS